MQLKDLPIGSKVRDPNTKYYGEPIIWRIIDHNHAGYPENSTTLLSDKIICVKSFDAKEPTNSNSDRRSYGNNRYLHSNIRQWLNKSGYDWFEKQHNADEPPISDYVWDGYNPYDTEKGFLANFSPEMRNALLLTELTVAKNTVTDGGGSEIVEDLIFLLSNTEVGLANENKIVEGSKFPIFTDNASRVVYPTQEAVDNSTYSNADFIPSKGWRWWLRTPNSTYSWSVRLVYSDGSLYCNYACLGRYGVLPALNLESDVLVSEAENGVYDLVFDTKYILIKSENLYYGVEDDELVNTLPTFENFKEYGISTEFLIENQDMIKELNNLKLILYYDGDRIPEIKYNVQLANELRFLISKDKENYFAYDGEWVGVDREDIMEEGMTKLEDITQEEWSEFNMELHKDSFEILVGLYSETPGEPILKSMEVEYAENGPPIIIDAEIDPDDIHNEFATITADVKDYEGDKISFKTLIKKAGTYEFVQVSPEEGWHNRNSYETIITQAYNYPYFNPGINQIKLIVKDERGEESEWIGNILLSNENPTITVTYDDFKLKAVIGDDDDDDIAYRISVNNELIFDYTNFMPTKATVNFVFADYLNFGVENLIKVEAKDTHGGYASEEFIVIGTYRGLLFKNENDEYFVNDKGEILMDLLFDGTLIGGQISETKKVILENRHEFPITNVSIEPENSHFVTGAELEISETEMPFNPKNKIVIPNIMPALTEKEFYVRVKTTRNAHQGGYFYIKSNAIPVD